MTRADPTPTQSVFRTSAWVQAWIDTWGHHPAITLIDLGGRAEPLEQVYITRFRLRGVLPVGSLCLPGVGHGAISCPRAEHNDINSLISATGNGSDLTDTLKRLRWSQFYLPDLTDFASQTTTSLAQHAGWPLHTEHKEPAYAIENVTFTQYLSGLKPGTRLRYFKRKKRLEALGQLERRHYSTLEADTFFDQHDQFHQARWGQPCYSERSRRFMGNFLERLEAAGGQAIMEVQTLDGSPLSTLFDVVWRNRRYNLQSGYRTEPLPGLSLGSLHLGLGIEEALQQGQSYDLLAGEGKHSNYKQSIANTRRPLTTLICQKPWLGHLRKLVNCLRDLKTAQEGASKDSL